MAVIAGGMAKEPSCDHCPKSCPMHAGRLGCHGGGAAKAGSIPHDCAKHQGGGLGFTQTGCHHGTSGVTTIAARAVLPVPLRLVTLAAADTVVAEVSVALPQGYLARPFHPPRV